jgi:hypothetical protein
LRARLSRIRHLRRADVRLDLELAAHAIDQDLQVEFTHALDDRLAALDVGRHAEARVFLRQAVEGDAHLLLSALVFGSTATSMTGSGNSIRSSTTGFCGRRACRPCVDFSPTSARCRPRMPP